MTALSDIGRLRPEVKTKWLAALRSGDYRQGEGLLSYQDDGSRSFCCLGVLCDLAAREGVLVADARPATGGNSDGSDEAGDEAAGRGYESVVRYEDGDGNTGVSMPPEGLIGWAYEVPPVQFKDWRAQGVAFMRPVDLASMNDDHGMTFEQIADAIEADL